MPNKRKICTENNNTSQTIFIPTLNSWYPIENVINSAYRKVLDFKENAEKILEKEKLETLSLNEFSKAILDSRSFNISLHNYCIVLKCYITLEKDKDVKKKRNDQTPPTTPILTSSNQQNPLLSLLNPSIERSRFDSMSSIGANSDTFDSPINSLTSSTINLNTPNTPLNTQISSGGAKKVNVEVIMRSNPFRVDENEKTTRMELIRNSTENGMLRFTYYVKPEFEARKINRETNTEMFENGKLIVFTNDFFTVYQNANNETEISLNEIIQSMEEQKRTEALGEKLCILLKDRPRHRALLTNECKLNSHTLQQQQQQQHQHQLQHYQALNNNDEIPLLQSQYSASSQPCTSSQEDETFYTRELINIYGQPIVPSFHKYFNYQLSNTHYGYRTLRRLLNCDILKKFVKITKEEIKSLDRVVEFVQLTTDKCLSALQLNLTAFYDPARFQNGIVKESFDTWYVGCLKEMFKNETNINKEALYTTLTSQSNGQITETSKEPLCLQTSHNEYIQCDQASHLWFCLQDYGCKQIDELLLKLQDYINLRNNKSELILVHTIHPIFEYKDVLVEARRILAVCLTKSISNVALDEIITNQLPVIAREHVENLLNKYINFDSTKRIINYTALFEILMILKRELSKEKNDEMKYSHFLCTLERANQEKLKLAIMQLKCVPCLNKFTTNYTLINTNTSITNLPSTPTTMTSTSSNRNSLLQQQQQNAKMNVVSHTNMSRLLKQMSLIVSTELQQIAIDLIERQEEDKIVKYIRLKDEFKQFNQITSLHMSQSTPSICSTIKPLTTNSTIQTPANTVYHKPPSFLSRNLSTELATIATTPSSSSSSFPSTIPTTSLSISNSLSQYSQQQNQDSSSIHTNSKYNQHLNNTNKTDITQSSSLQSFAHLQPHQQIQQQQQHQQQQSLPKPITTGKLNLFNPHIQLITDKMQDMPPFTSSYERQMSMYKTNRY